MLRDTHPFESALERGTKLQRALHGLAEAYELLMQRGESCGDSQVLQQLYDMLEQVEARCQSLMRALQESLQEGRMLRTIADNTSDVIVIKDMQGHYLFLNPAAAKGLGRPTEELLGKTDADFFDEATMAHMRAHEQQVRDSRAPVLEEQTVQFKDGPQRTYLITRFPFFGPDGEVAGVIASGRDITARKQQEETMARLAAVVQATDDVILTIDAESGRIQYANRAAERVFGYEASKLVGMRGAALVTSERLKALGHLAEQLKRGETVEPYQTVRVGQHGESRTFSVGLFPICDEQHRVFAYGAIMREITQLKDTFGELARRRAELASARELDDLKDHFLSTISHEMRTPLSLITGYAELLEDRYPGDALLEGIQDGSRRLAEHINNMLDYSALISGKLKLDRSEIWLPEVIEHAIAVEQECYREKGIALKSDWPENLPVMQADFRRLSQVLHELLDNAQKFTPPGGQVSVKAIEETGCIRLSVCDTGPGIADEDIQRIWKAFTQLDVSDAMRKGGLGLGLTIVKKLVELHGGHVEVHSQPDHGCCFTVILPIG